MHAPSPRIRRLVAGAVIPISVMAAAGLVWRSSYAAFSSDTRNAGNNWSTGSVALTDDDAGSARFTVTDLVPDQTDTKCIKVTASANVPGTVKLYLLNPITSAQGLENHIRLTVKQGDGGGFGSCTGFVAGPTIVANQTLAGATAAYNSYATGAGSWVTTGVVAGESKTYQLSWTFDASGMTQEQLDGLQGARTGVDFEWELQNN